MALKDHSVYLHQERNGYTVRFYEDNGNDKPTRYVFTSADEMLDFLIGNFLGVASVTERGGSWVVPVNDKRVVLP